MPYARAEPTCDADNVPDKPEAVVFAVGRKGGELFDSSNLYSFSKVTLVRTYDDLESRGIATYVVPIANESPEKTDAHEHRHREWRLSDVWARRRDQAAAW